MDDRPTGDIEWGPQSCPYGHELGAGRVLVGWSPCRCTIARDHNGGHTTWECRACSELTDKRKTIRYHPPHVRAVRPG